MSHVAAHLQLIWGGEISGDLKVIILKFSTILLLFQRRHIAPNVHRNFKIFHFKPRGKFFAFPPESCQRNLQYRKFEFFLTNDFNENSFGLAWNKNSFIRSIAFGIQLRERHESKFKIDFCFDFFLIKLRQN